MRFSCPTHYPLPTPSSFPQVFAACSVVGLLGVAAADDWPHAVLALGTLISTSLAFQVTVTVSVAVTVIVHCCVIH